MLQWSCGSQNTLLLGTSMGPFITYVSKVPCSSSGGPTAGCTDVCPDPGQDWRSPVLAAIWGVAVIVNAISVAITLLFQVGCQGAPSYPWSYRVSMCCRTSIAFPQAAGNKSKSCSNIPFSGPNQTLKAFLQAHPLLSYSPAGPHT